MKDTLKNAKKIQHTRFARDIALTKYNKTANDSENVH